MLTVTDGYAPSSLVASILTATDFFALHSSSQPPLRLFLLYFFFFFSRVDFHHYPRMVLCNENLLLVGVSGGSKARISLH